MSIPYLFLCLNDVKTVMEFIKWFLLLGWHNIVHEWWMVDGLVDDFYQIQGNEGENVDAEYQKA